MFNFQLIIQKFFNHIWQSENFYDVFTLDENAKIVTFVNNKERYCIKKITNQSTKEFNHVLLKLNELSDSIYQLVRNNNGEYISLVDNESFIIYKFVLGKRLSASDSINPSVASVIASLHNSMMSILPESITPNLVNDYNLFCDKSKSNLDFFSERNKFANIFLSEVDMSQLRPCYIHGDLYNKNVIISNESAVFIDFDNLKVYFHGYEVMRYFFISNLYSVEKFKCLLLKNISFFKTYTNICPTDLCLSFKLYLFTLCCEFRTEQLAMESNSRELSYFSMQRALLRRELLVRSREISLLLRQ